MKEVQETNPSTGALYTVFSSVISEGLPLFVIIDEYDHYANDLIAMGNNLGDDVYRRMVSANGIIRDFYENLKAGTKDAVRRIFITGASPVMINDLTSGFNITKNITMSPHYNEMLGFTLDEVYWLAGATGIPIERIRDDLADYYNGYRFSLRADKTVYNPSMILYYFDQLQESPETGAIYCLHQRAVLFAAVQPRLDEIR
jgi:hypothetical protein